VGVGNVVVLHDGRLYSHFARDRGPNGVVSVDHGPAGSMSGARNLNKMLQPFSIDPQ